VQAKPRTRDLCQKYVIKLYIYTFGFFPYINLEFSPQNKGVLYE